MQFNTTSEIITDLKSGRMVILLDDENRENEGDIIMASHFITPQAINFMIKEARGLVCVALDSEQIKKLSLPLMVNQNKNTSPNRTAFTLSVEASEGVTTGISAKDRAHTIQVLTHPEAKPEDLISPGHVFPIQAQDGGVLKRAGHTEASVDLCRLARLMPSAVICEITNEDGSMARTPDLFRFAKKHSLKIGTIEDLIKYRLENESLVEEKIKTPFSTDLGPDWTARVFYDRVNDTEHLVLIKGKIDPKETQLVRVHSSCLSGDLFQDNLLKSGHSLKRSLDIITQQGSGILVYLRSQKKISTQIEFHKKNSEKNYLFDSKDYGIGAQILRALKISKICLITNSSTKRIGLKAYGLSIEDTRSLSEKPYIVKSKT